MSDFDILDEELLREDADDVDRDLFSDAEPAPYAPVRDDGTSRTKAFLQGASLNMGDDIAGAAAYGAGKLGVGTDYPSYKAAYAAEGAPYEASARKHGVVHGLGQLGTGAAAGVAAGAGLAAQAAVGGLSASISEIADGSSPLRTLIAGLFGTAGGALGAKFGNWLGAPQKARIAKGIEALKETPYAMRPGTPNPNALADLPNPSIPKMRHGPLQPDELRFPASPARDVPPWSAPEPRPVGRPPASPEPAPWSRPSELEPRRLPPEPGMPEPQGPLDMPPDDALAPLAPSGPQPAPARGPLPMPEPLPQPPAALSGAPQSSYGPSMARPLEMPPDTGAAARRFPSLEAAASAPPRPEAGPPGLAYKAVDKLAEWTLPGLVNAPVRRGMEAARQQFSRPRVEHSAGLDALGRGAGAGMTSALEDEFSDTLAPQKAKAQDIAYADSGTLAYALQATLASGAVGLSEDDEAALTKALVTGNDRDIAATDYRLRQQYPGYARMVERELREMNEEDR